MRLFVLLLLILATAPAFGQQAFPVEFEVGLSTVVVQNDFGLAPGNSISQNLYHNLRLGLGLHLINPTKIRIDGYDPPSKAKMLYGFFNYGHFLGEDTRKKFFFKDLGLGGTNSLFLIGYKINRYREIGKGNIRFNNWFAEFSGNILKPDTSQTSSGENTTTELRTNDKSAMNFNLTLGYQFGSSIRINKSDRYNQAGRFTIWVSPQIHIFHIILPKGMNTVKELMIQEGIYRDYVSEADEKNEYTKKDFATFGGGLGLKFSMGWTFKNERVPPVFAYVDARYYIADNSKASPGFNSPMRPFLMVGLMTNLNYGFPREDDSRNIRHLQRYRSYY
jgi:hypothetical protein